MNGIEILFDLPINIIKGLQEGTLSRWGGVIRSLDGRIVMHLKEIPGLQELLSGNAKILEQGAKLQSLMGLQIGLQAASLGVSIVGFAVIAYKLEKINVKLSEISNKIDRIADEVDWTNISLQTKFSSDLIGSLKQAQWLEDCNKIDSIISVRENFEKAEIYYDQILREMLKTKRAHQRSDVFLLSYRYLALSGLAKIRLEWLFNGAEKASIMHQVFLERLEEIRKYFLEPLISLKPSSIASISPSELPRIRANLSELQEDFFRVYSYGAEIAYAAKNAISLQEWEAIGKGVTDRPIIFLQPSEETQIALTLPQKEH